MKKLNTQQFIEALQSTPPCWRIDHDGVIRGSMAMRSDRPATDKDALCLIAMLSNPKADAVSPMEVYESDHNAIWRAVANQTDHDPTLRQQIIEACRLVQPD